MNNNLIFVPILKNKATAEPTAIKASLDIFSKRIIPYIEIINEEKSSRAYMNTKEAMGKTIHFEQFYRRKDINITDIIEKTINNIDINIISSLQIIDANELINNFDEIIYFINTIHEKKQNVSIRIPSINNIDTIKKLIVLLKKDDYLIIDIDDNDYKSLILFLDIINNAPKKCKILIFSNERPKNSTNKELVDFDYNLSFNTSVIDAIKNNSFKQDGFGSYCAAKNDLNQGGSYKYPVYGAFVIYDYKENNFYSIKSNTPDQISKAYSQLKNKININRNVVDSFFQKTPISHNMICSLLDNKNKKGSASQYISFSIVHYIEEIYNNLLI